VSGENEDTESLFDIISKDTLLWLDSSDMYKDKEFYNRVSGF